MYRGEIQNDSIGGNYNRSLDYSPSFSGLGAIGRHETRNFAVGAPLRGAGIGRCEEEAYNCCGLYGRGENEEMEDDPCWDGYEMIGTKMKKGREVPNCVPVGGDEPPKIEVPNMTDFIRLFSLGNKDAADKLEKTIYGNGKPFTKEQLTKIILDKNKVIADLEENAYGGDWGADFEKMIEEHNRNNQAQLFNGEGGGWQEEMFSPEEIAKTEKNWQDYLAKNPQLKGEGFWDDVRKGVVKHNERKKITPISEEDWKKQMADFKAPTENWGADELYGGVLTQAKLNSAGDTLRFLSVNRDGLEAQVARFSLSQLTDLEEVIDYYLPMTFIGADTKDFYRQLKPIIAREIQAKSVAMAGEAKGEGGAAPKVEAKPSPVAAAAEALQPVRTAIQNKVGDLIYGAETDPKKQRKGLLGISEEGKEASKKKVIKNIVKPLMDGWNQLFNPDKVKADNEKRLRAEAKKNAAKVGWLYELPDGEYDVTAFENPGAKLVRQPRRYHRWVQKNAKYNTGYYIDDYDEGSTPYIKIPNPIKGLKPNYTIDELKKNNIPFFVPVNRVNATGDNEEVWRGGFEGDEIWVPQDIGSKVYQALNQYKMKLDEEKERAYYESLSEVEKREYRERKALEKDTGMTEAAKAKVAKDIADEEAKEKPDTERLAKMKAAQERVRVKGVDNFWKGQTQGKQVSERIYKDQMAKDAAERQSANIQQQSDDMAAFKALSPAERTIQLEAYRKDLQDSGFTDEQIEEQIGAVGGAKKGEAGEAVQPKRRVEVKIPQRQLDRMEDEAEDFDAEKIAFADAVTVYTSSGDDYIVQNARGTGLGWRFEKNRYVWDAAAGDMIGFLGEGVFYDLAKEVRKKEKWDFQVPKPDTSEMTELRDRREAIEKTLPKAVRDKLDSPVSAGDAARAVFRAALEAAGIPVLKGSTQINFQLAAKLGKRKPDDDELVGEGAIELTLLTAGQRLFNPTGNMTMANKQTFTPDYDAYGATVEQGRLNAFNLSRSMYNQQQAIELPDFDLIQDNTSLRFYLKDDEDVILVGIRGTDVKSWTDLYTWAVIGAKQDFRMTTRFQDDLQKLLVFQKQYPMTQYYYVGVGSSLAGSIADRFLDMGLMDEAITYNPSIEKKYVLDGNIHNHRVYLDTDPLFMLMGQYSPNTEIRKNASAANFYNPIKEKDFLIKSHSIFPVYNPAFEGGGMMGAGKTYTIEEWKAIFDAKLEQKRQQIEARAAKKKQTAKAKRERAKAVRDGRDEPPPLETPAVFRTSRVQKATPPKQREPEPEEEYPEVEVTEYKMGDETYLVEDAREGLAFEDRRVFDSEEEEIGNLTVDDVGKTLVKMVMAREKPKAPSKPRLKVVAPASARVELREELVAAQPREPEGEFASEAAEPLQLVVAEIERQPQRAYMAMLKSPMLTEADRRLMMNLHRSSMAPMKKVKLLARSGLARKVMEMLGIDESAFQSQRARARIADKMEKRTTAVKVREIVLPDDIEAVFKAQEEGLISYCAERITKKKGMGESLSTMIRYTDTFAKCGFGCLGLTAECMDSDPFDLYYSSEMNSDLDPQDKAGERSLTLMMALTQADENYMSQVGFWTQETRADTSMSFGRVKHERFLLPRLTEVCMGQLEGIAGISGVSDTTRSAGMGYKRRNEWRVSFTGVSEVKRWTDAVKTQYTAKIKSEIVPKIMAIAADLKPKMLARGEVMKENLLASLTAEQKAELKKRYEMLEEEKRKNEEEKKRKEENRRFVDERDKRLADIQLRRLEEFRQRNIRWRAEIEEKGKKYDAKVKGTEFEGGWLGHWRHVKQLSSGVVNKLKLTNLLDESQFFQRRFAIDPFNEKTKRYFVDGLGNVVYFCLEWDDGDGKKVADTAGALMPPYALTFPSLERDLKLEPDGYDSQAAKAQRTRRDKALDDMGMLCNSARYLRMRILSIVRTSDDGKILAEKLPLDLEGVMAKFSFKSETEDRFYTGMMRMLSGERRPAGVELADLIRRFSIIEGAYGVNMESLWEKKKYDEYGEDFMDWAFGASWRLPPS